MGNYVPALETNRHIELPFKNFSESEHATWRSLFMGLENKRSRQLHKIFDDGVKYLKITSERVPDLGAVNELLMNRTGFRGVPVEGLENPESFFFMLSQRKFPIGNFIREARDLTYTPAPDVFHDLYGHLPFLVDSNYADFCEDFGKRAIKYLGAPYIVKQFETLFWFGVEFPLVKTPEGLRIFGAGIASSISECDYALSSTPELVEFDPEKIRHQEYRIDEMQKKLFVLENPQQLYGCLDSFEAGTTVSALSGNRGLYFCGATS